MKLLLVDDESLARQRLRRLLERLRPDAEIFEAADGESALALVSEQSPDLLFLDISMPGMSGVDVARALLEVERAPAVIFCTAYDEYALDALRNQAAAYLLKPVRERDLEAALRASVRVNRAQLAVLGVAADERELISSSGHRGVESLPLRDVRCFIAEDKYVRACAPQGELLLSESLRDLESEFGARFLRVHRKALVARAHLLRLLRDEEGWTAELSDCRERPRVSRRHVAELKAAVRGEA